MGVMQKKSTTARSWFLINIYYLCFSLPIKKKKKKRWHSTHQTLWPLRPRVIARIMLIRNPFRSNQLPERGHCFEVEYFFSSPRDVAFFIPVHASCFCPPSKKKQNARVAPGVAQKPPGHSFPRCPLLPAEKKGWATDETQMKKKRLRTLGNSFLHASIALCVLRLAIRYLRVSD